MDSEKLACNRIPFLSDSSCNRGDVDITTFESFPICQPIDPTQPAIGVPQVDFTLVPIQAPPCACANVEITGSGKAEERKSKDVGVKGIFKSIGDCCEGNYSAKIDVSVPCVPFDISGGSDSHSVSIDQICGLDAPSGTFNLGLCVDPNNPCTIRIDPKIKLSIPKQPEIDFSSASFDISSHCGSSYGGYFRIDREETSSCHVTYKPKLHLSLPKVSNVTTCDSDKIQQNVFFDSSGPDEKIIGAGRLHINGEYDSCDYLTYFCPTLDLAIPCPIKLSSNLGANKGKAKIRSKIRWKSEESYESSVSASFLEQDSGFCNLKYVEQTLDLGLPCPIKDPLEINAKVGWGDDQSSVIVTVAEKDKDNCQLKSTLAPIDLKLPCPVNIDPLHLKINVTTGSKDFGGSADILEQNSDGCGLKAGDREITIRVPTGGGGGGANCTILNNMELEETVDREYGSFLTINNELKPAKEGDCSRKIGLTFKGSELQTTIKGENCDGTIPEKLIHNKESIKFMSAPDSNVFIEVVDGEGGKGATVKIGVYYV